MNKQIYTTLEGTTIEYNKVPTSEVNKLIDSQLIFKVNLPSDESNFNSGNGEGVWACCDTESYNLITGDVEGLYVVSILNDSVYYNGLCCGDNVLVETRKNKRPVAIYNELYHTYGESNWNQKEFRETILKTLQ